MNTVSVKYKDYYETLGVERDASADTLKKAFRKLARKYHPDHAKDNPSAEAKFKEINEAYEVLGDPEKRAKYDQLGPNWQQGADFNPPPGWERAGGMGGMDTGAREFHFGGTGFSDFFEQFFGGAGFAQGGRGYGAQDFGGYGGGFQHVPSKGGDLTADLLVTLEEANNGGERQLSFRREGSSKAETLKVKIPAGVREGQRIRLAGKGQAGQSGPGDLLLTIRLERHPDFEVDGADLVYDLEIPPWEAALGCKKTIPTLKQKVAVTVPPGAKSGSRMRLRGLGMKKPDGSRGDLYAVVEVIVEAATTDEQRTLWEKLKQAY